MTNVVHINGALNPDNVLNEAIGAYDSVMVIGYAKDGTLDARASLNLEQVDCLWMLEQFKLRLLRGDYSEGGE